MYHLNNLGMLGFFTLTIFVLLHYIISGKGGVKNDLNKERIRQPTVQM